MKTTSEHVQRWRANHHKALEALARSVGCQTSGKTLWHKLNRLESQVMRVCLDYTNGERGVTLDQWEVEKDRTRLELVKIFGKLPTGVFINGDPRGYMLKLDSEKVTIPEGMYKDWGSDGILAAMIEEEA